MSPKIRDRIVELRRVQASELRSHNLNWRKHPAPQRAAVRSLLDEIGWADAVLAYETPEGLTLVDGHLRAGMSDTETIPVLILDVTAKEATKLLATLDPSASMAETDQPTLRQILSQVKVESSLLARLEEIAGTQTTETAEPLPDLKPRSRVKKGELWHLGDHRVLCADSTDPTSYKRLFDLGGGASMVFTDPPYGMDLRGGRGDRIIGDNLQRDSLVNDLLAPALKLAAEHTDDQGAFYVWHTDSTRAHFDEALQRAGLVQLEYIIWAKPSAGLGLSDYRRSHEPCFYAAKAGHRPIFHGARKEQTVWRFHAVLDDGVSAVLGTGVLLSDGEGNEIWIGKPPKGRKTRHIRLTEGSITIEAGDSGTVWEVSRDSSPEHPTQKPAALAIKAIENSSRPGQVVLDPFLGSGSTLMGAEKAGRICYGMELDPKYCDVIVRRWEAKMGRRARKAK